MTGLNKPHLIDLHQSDHVKSYGHSMFPILHSEDIVYYKKLPFAQIKLNDIVVVRQNDHYVTHRVIHKTSKEIITKGDNNKVVDPPVTEKNIIGIVYKVKRGKTEFHPDTYYLLQSSIYYEHIKAIIGILNKNAIPYILLKGLPLHLKYHHEHPRRKFFDVDILIPHSHRALLLTKLAELGFERRYDFLSPTHEQLIDKPIEETCMKKLDGFAISVDIHYEAVFMMTQIGTLNPLYEQKYIDAFTAELFDHTVPYTAHDLQCILLDDEYLFVYLSLHFFHHSFKGIYRLQLIDAILRSISPKRSGRFWKDVADIIVRFRLQGYVYGTCMSMRKYIPHPHIPQSFIARIRPPKPQQAYLERYFRRERIYEEFGSIRSGMLLFRNLYTLSDNPWHRKIQVFTKPAVVFMLVWLLYYGIRSKLLFSTRPHAQ